MSIIMTSLYVLVTIFVAQFMLTLRLLEGRNSVESMG